MSGTPMSPADQKTAYRRLTPGRLGAALAALTLLLSIFSFTIVETGQVGVAIRTGSDQARVLAEPGIYPRLPFIERVWLIDTRLRSLEQETVQTYTTADQKTLQLGAWLIWQVSDPIQFHRATQAGKNPVDPLLLQPLHESLATVVASRTGNVIQQQALDTSGWRDALNSRLSPLGVRAIQVGLGQVALPEPEMTAIYQKMSAAAGEPARRLIDGLASDNQEVVTLQNRRRDQVLEGAIQTAQRTRETGEARLLAAYSGRYGQGRSFADLLKSPPPPLTQPAPQPQSQPDTHQSPTGRSE